VGGTIGLADVRLDLDDAACAPARIVIADEQAAEQGAGRLEGRCGEEVPVEDVTVEDAGQP
jgi:hypothetical protein